MPHILAVDVLEKSAQDVSHLVLKTKDTPINNTHNHLPEVIIGIPFTTVCTAPVLIFILPSAEVSADNDSVIDLVVVRLVFAIHEKYTQDIITKNE